MLLKLITLFLAALPHLAWADVGLGTFAIQHAKWNCAATIKAFSNASEIRLAYLANTFGNNRTCLRKLLLDPRPKRIEVILFNQACVRNKRCGAYEALRGRSLPQLRGDLEKLNGGLLRRLGIFTRREVLFLFPYLRPSDTLYVSPLLEHNVGRLAAGNLIAELRPLFLPMPSKVLWVDNPMLPGRKAKGADLLESHGAYPKLIGPTITNLDGTDGFKAGIAGYLKRTKAAEMSLLWIYEFNCNSRISSNFIDPRERKNCPKREQFSRLSQYLN